jgi:hypothetical protein
MNTTIEAEVVDLRDARRLLAVGRTKLNAMMRAGQVERRKIGRKSVVTVESIRRFVASLRQG